MIKSPTSLEHSLPHWERYYVVIHRNFTFLHWTQVPLLFVLWVLETETTSFSYSLSCMACGITVSASCILCQQVCSCYRYWLDSINKSVLFTADVTPHALGSLFTAAEHDPKRNTLVWTWEWAPDMVQNVWLLEQGSI